MAQSKTRSMGEMAGRVLITLIGASGLIVGAFMKWIRGLDGVKLGFRALYDRPFVSVSNMVLSVGFIVIVLGLLCIVGLATNSGWLTRLASALGIVVFILLLIQLYTGTGHFLPGPGPWLVLAGGVVGTIGGG